MNNLTLLLIDDDLAHNDIIQTMLATAGATQITIKQVNHLFEAFEVVAKTSVHIILLCPFLGNCQGLELLAEMHTVAPTIPIIVLADTEHEILEPAVMQEGAQDFLVKGQFDSRLLRRAIHYAIERRRIEAQIDFDKTLFSQVRNAIIATDATAQIIYWNQYAEKLYQWTAQEAIGQSIYQMIVTGDQTSSVETIFAQAEIVGDWEGEFAIQRKDGHTNPMYGTVTALTDYKRQLTGFVASAVDITERKLAENELKKYRHDLEQLVEARTHALTLANQELHKEILRREQIEGALQFRVELEKLVATISTAFIDLTPDQVDSTVNRALQALGKFVGVERGYVVLVAAADQPNHQVLEWCAPNIEPNRAKLQTLPRQAFTTWLEKLNQLGTIQINGPAILTPESTIEHDTLFSHDVQSIIATPILYGGVIVGFLSFETVHFPKHWIKDIVTLLTIVGQIFGSALQHKHTQAALYSSEERLRRLTDNMLDMICQINPDGIVEYISPSCMNILGYAPEVLLGQSVYSWLDPEDVESAKQDVETVGILEYRYQHADGHSLWLETLSSFLYADDGTFKGYIFASRDVTERKRAESDLQELNVLKTEFLSTAAHELRTPLASILGFSEILLTRQLDAERTQRYTQIINEQSIQLRKLVDSLLDISRLDSKQGLKLDLQPINPDELLTKILSPFTENSPRHHFHKEGVAECPPFYADPFRLGQVFQNLLSNAVKYSPEGGSVTIRVRYSEAEVQFSVQDEGIGMTPAQQTHLFERFYRANASNTTISGTGLGLAISKLIVELHGGRIWVESANEVGTTIYFTLPISGIGK
jgi:PAS domain S-box-containing protein